MNVRKLIPGLILLFTIAMLPAIASSSRSGAVTAESGRSDVAGFRERLQRNFEEQRTADGRTQFVSRTPDSTVMLTGDQATLALGDTTLRMQLVGAVPSASAGAMDELGGRSHYLIGNDPAKWRTNVRTFGKVRYNDVYRGVDVVYYGRGQQLEYDFVVAPGADPDRIRLRFDGADRVALDDDGGLRVRVGSRSIRMDPPCVYQAAAGGTRTIPGRYLVDGSREVRFEIGAYDHNERLTIDPVITYSTFFGGVGRDAAVAVAVDPRGFIYLTGTTSPGNTNSFPTVNAILPDLTLHSAAFVTKLTPDGSTVVYSTYLGGRFFGGTNGHGIAVDRRGHAYVVGSTSMSDFPIVNPVQATCGAGFNNDAFVSKLAADGSAFEYSTCLGGPEDFDEGFGIALDEAGNAYVTGSTRCPDFPTKNALQPVHAGGVVDAFVSVIRPEGSELVYSTFLGGKKDEEGFAIALDERRNIYVTGRTRSSDFPVRNAFQAALAGGNDAFVTKLERGGQQIAYSTYLGGAALDPSGFPTGRGGEDMGLAIAVDERGNATVTGKTNSPDFPTLNAVQPTIGGPQHSSLGVFTRDLFVARFDAAGSAQYVTFVGGNGNDAPTAIALDDRGVAWITGTTESADFPSVRAGQRSFGDGLVFSTRDGGVNWTAAGGGIGHRDVRAIAVNPLDPAVIYTATHGAGVFKTTDGGRRWTAVNTGLANLFVDALAIDPTNPSRLFAGTEGGGAFRSVDGGANWSLSLGPANLPVTTLAIAPTNPSIIYAGAAARGFGAVFTSTDGGETWRFTFTDLVEALAVDPSTPSTVYAGTPDGIFKSTDGGTTFALFPLSSFPNGVKALAIDPMTPSTIYAGADLGLYKSTDAGVTWTFRGTGLGGNPVALAVDPSNPLTVYAGTIAGVFKTTDGGATKWTRATAGITSPVVNTLTIVPGSPDRLYAGSLGTSDAFVMAIRPNGTIRYSSFLGGNAEDLGGGITIGERRRIYVSGGTSSLDFPLVDPVQPVFGGVADVFLTVFSRAEGRRHER